MSVERHTWGPKELPVPFASPWSGERVRVGDALVVGARGLAYRDERAGDRDRHGVLWARVEGQAGAGRPRFGDMHPGRQRSVMLGMRCQVCGGEASRTSKGWLFLVPRGEQPAGGEVPEGALTTKPPLCLTCAETALAHCPHLRDCAVVRVRKARVWGVFGEMFAPGTEGAGHLPYGHGALRWLLATQVVLELNRSTRTTLGAG
jgi:hypothetical protein